MYGRGDILRIDLSTGEITREPMMSDLVEVLEKEGALA